jgi:hypothetical protein
MVLGGAAPAFGVGCIIWLGWLVYTLVSRYPRLWFLDFSVDLIALNC